jgi:hypothetical protein
MKVCIDDGLYIHIRVHRRANEELYDFYSLHETIKHNIATCVFTEGFYLLIIIFFILVFYFIDDPLTYFNY